MVQVATQRKVDNNRESGLQPEDARGVQYEEFERTIQSKFLSSLNESERNILGRNDRQDPNLKKIIDRYNEGRKEQLKMWMEENTLEMSAWQEKVIQQCNSIVSEDVKSMGVRPTEMKAYLIPEELLPPKASGWTFDEISCIVIVKHKESEDGYRDLIGPGLTHHVAIHEAYHLNTGGFNQHRLEEGAAEWCSLEKLMDMSVNYQVSYRVDVGIIDELIGAIEKISNVSNDEAKNIFKKAYFSGNKDDLKQIFGDKGWAKIETVAEGYNDPFLDQDKLANTYEPEMKSVIADIVAERTRDNHGLFKPEDAVGVPYAKFEKMIIGNFPTTLSERDRDIYENNNSQNPELKRIYDRYYEGRKEQLKMWMEVNSLEMPVWQEKVLNECSAMVAEDVKANGGDPTEMKAYLIPEELLPAKASGWTMDELKCIVIVKHKEEERKDGYIDLIGSSLTHHVAIHEAYHLNTGGFSQHRLEEGAAEWCSLEKLMDMSVSYQVHYRVDVDIIDKLIGAIEKISKVSNDEAKNIFKKAYFSGNKAELKEIFGEYGWARIEEVAKQYNDPLLDQEKLKDSYQPEMEAAIKEIIKSRTVGMYDALKLPPARVRNAQD